MPVVYLKRFAHLSSLLAVALWLGAAGWHGALHHAAHASGEHDCTAHDHAHDAVDTDLPVLSQGDPASSYEGGHALCLACAVAAQAAAASTPTRLTVPPAGQRAPIIAASTPALSNDSGAYHLRGPPA